jgi:cytidine deaminase
MITTEELLLIAQQATTKAYAPYSKFYVGAALLTEKGNVYSGCNVENASYGLTICAERNAIFAAVNAEGPDMSIVKMVVLTSEHVTAPSCGACRQVIFEFADSNTEIHFYKDDELVCRKMNELLPDSFDL